MQSLANLNSRRTILPPLVFQSLLKLEDHFVSKTSPNEHSPFTPKTDVSTSSSKHMMFFGEFKQALLVSGYAGMEGRQFINLFGCRISTSWIPGQFITTKLSPGTVTPNGW